MAAVWLLYGCTTVRFLTFLFAVICCFAFRNHWGDVHASLLCWEIELIFLKEPIQQCSLEVILFMAKYMAEDTNHIIFDCMLVAGTIIWHPLQSQENSLYPNNQ